MSYRSKNIVVFILLLFTINSKAQDYLFSGSIKDKIDNTAVYNAEIYNENGKAVSYKKYKNGRCVSRLVY